MKQLALLFALITAYSFSFAGNQDDNDGMKTLFGRNRSNGGYGALSFNYSEINHQDAFVMGARGAWVINHAFAIGLGGYGFVNNIDVNELSHYDADLDLAGGYGGLILEPIIASRLPVHISLPVLLGIGGVAYVDDYEWNWYDDNQSDVFLVCEPGVELEFNMTRHMRLAASFSYRFTSDVEMIDIKPDVLRGYNVGLTFKFGKF